MSGFAPYTAELVRLSLVEAQLSKRTDLSWERRQLERALVLGPDIPEVRAEMLHLAILSNDKGMIRDALKDSVSKAEPAANYAYYRRLADEALAR